MYTHCNFGRMEDEDRFKTISEFREYMVGEDRLRDVTYTGYNSATDYLMLYEQF